MNTTSHTEKRLRQRGRSKQDLSVISKYGEECQGVFLLTHRRVKKTIVRLRRWLTKHASPQVQKRARGVRHLISRLERLVNWMMVMSPESREVVTVYRADRKRQRKFLRGDIRPVLEITPWGKS